MRKAFDLQSGGYKKESISSISNFTEMIASSILALGNVDRNYFMEADQ